MCKAEYEMMNLEPRVLLSNNVKESMQCDIYFSNIHTPHASASFIPKGRSTRLARRTSSGAQQLEPDRTRKVRL
jgi:hypothetical protein